MNKFKVVNVIIALSIAVPVHAQEIRPVVADKKATVSQLVRDNQALTSSIQQQKAALEHEAHMYSKPDQYGKLTEVLNAYQDFIDQKGDLPEDKRRALDQIVDASAEAGKGRGQGTYDNTPISDASIQDALDQNQQLLDNQAALLNEKENQLKDFQNQLAKIKNQLAANNKRHVAAVPTPSKPIVKTVIKEVPVKEVVYKDNPELAKSLAEKSKELEDSKRNLAAFKDQLARNNRRFQDAVKESKVNAKTNKLDQVSNQRLADENKKLQDNLNALKEENIRNIRRAEQAAKDAAVAKALAQRNLIDDKSKQLENYKNELNDLKGKLADTNKRLEETTKAAKQNAKANALDNEEAKRQEQTIAQKEDMFNDLIEHNKVLADKVRDLQNEIARKDKVSPKAVDAQLDNAQVARLQQAIEQKTAQVNDLLNQNKQLASTLNDLQDRVAKNDSAPAQMQRIVADKENLLKSKDDLLEEKDAQLARLKDELSRIKDDLSKTNDRYEAAIKEYKDKTKGADLDKVESAALAKQLIERTAALDDLTAKNRNLENTLQALNSNKDKLSDIERMLMEKDNQIASLKSELAHALEQNTLMHRQLDQEDKDLNEIRNKAELFRNKYLEQLGLVERKEKDIQALNEQMSKTPKTIDNTTQVAELKNQIAAAQNEAKGLRDDLAKTSKALADNKEELNAKNDQLRKLEEKVSSMPSVRKEVNPKGNGNESTLRQQLADAHDQMATLRAKLSNRGSADDEDLPKELAAAQEQIATLQAQLKKDDEVFAEIKNKGIALKEKIASLNNNLALKESQIDELKLNVKQVANDQTVKDLDNAKEQTQSANALKEKMEKMAKASLTPEEQAQFDNLKKQYEIVVQNPLRNDSNINPEAEELKRHYEIVVKSPEEIAQSIKDNRTPSSEGVATNIVVSDEQQQLAELKNEAKVLRDLLVKAKEEQKNLGNDTELTETKNKLEAAEQEAASLKNQIALLKDAKSLSTLDNLSVSQVKDKLQSAEKEAQDLKNEIAALKAERQASVPVVDSSKLNETENKLKVAEQQAEDLKRQIAALKEVQANTVAKSDFDELKKQYEIALKAPVKEVIKVVPANDSVVAAAPVIIKADTRELESKLSAAQQEAQVLKDKIVSLQVAKEKESIDAEVRFKDLKGQLNSSQDQFNMLKAAEILKNREIITSKQDQSLTLQNTIKDHVVKLADKTTELKQKEERLALQQTLQAKQRERIDLLMRKNQLVVEYQNRLVAKLSAYQQKFDGATSDWDTHKAQYESKLAEFKSSIETMNRNNAALDQQIKIAKDEKDQVYGLMDRFKDRLKETADVNENQSKELAAYREKADTLEEKMLKMQVDMIGTENEFKKNQETLGKLKANHDQVLKDVQVKDLSLTMTQASMQEKTKVLQALVNQLKDQVKLSDAQLGTMRQQLQDAQMKVAQANRHEDLERLKEMLKSSREEIIQMSSLIKNKEQQVTKLQSDLQDSSIDFTSQHKAIAALKEDMEKQQASITKLNTDIDWKNKEIARLKAQLKAKKVDLLPASLQGVELVLEKDRKQIADLTAQLEAAKAKIKGTSLPTMSDPKGLRQALLDAQEQIVTLKQKLNQKIQGLVKNDPAVIQMTKELQSLNQSLVDVMKENTNLKDKNEAIFNQMHQMQEDLLLCQDQIKALPKE